MSNDLQTNVTLKGVDQLSSVLNQNAAAIQDLASKMNAIGGDQGFNMTMKSAEGNILTFKSAAKDAAQETGNLGAGMKGFLGEISPVGLSVAAVGAALAAFAVHAAEAADELQGIHNRASIIFGADFPQMEKAADGMAESMHRGAGEMLDFEGEFGGMLTGFGVGKKASEELSVSLTKLVEDFASFHHLSDDDAMSKIEEGMRGAQRSVATYGLAVGDAKLEEYAMKIGIDQKVSAMGDAEKMYLRSQMILEQEKKIEGDVIKNQSTLSNETKNVGAAWNDFSESVGGLLELPVSTFLEEMAVELRGISGIFGLLETGAKEVIGDFEALFGIYGTKDYAVPGAITPEAMTANAGNLKQLVAAHDAAQKKIKETALSFGDNGSGSDKAAKAAEQLQTALDNLQQKYADDSSQIGVSLTQLDETHQTKMQSIQDKLSGTKDSLQQLKDAYSDTVDSMNQKGEDLLAKQDGVIKSLQDKIDQLNKKAAQEAAQGSTSAQTNDDIEKAKAELAKAQAERPQIIATLALTAQQQADAVTSEGRGTALNEALALAKEKTQKADDYSTNQTKLNNTLDDENAKLAQEQENYKNVRQQMNDTQKAVEALATALSTAMENGGTVTKKGADEMKKNLDALMKQMDNNVKIIDKSSSATDNLPAATDGGMKAIADVTTSSMDKAGTALDAYMAKVQRASAAMKTISGSATIATNDNGIPLSVGDVNNTGQWVGGVAPGGTVTNTTASVPQNQISGYSTMTLDQSNAAVAAAIQARTVAEVQYLGQLQQKKYASGGVISSPTMALMGEGQYSEAVVPLPDGRSIPVQMQGGSQGGGDINITITGMVVQKEADVDKVLDRIARKIQLIKSGSY